MNAPSLQGARMILATPVACSHSVIYLPAFDQASHVLLRNKKFAAS